MAHGPTPENPSVDRAVLEEQTGALFGNLWPQYDDSLFDASVELFHRRLPLAGIAEDFFAGKDCLDAGCGGGRASIAMAELGARSVVGVDLGAQGLEDARRRAAKRGLANVRFERGSLLELPLEDASVDAVWCAGVLMITADEERALDELLRVLRPGGRLYLLVYATEGLRWPLVQLLRPLAARIGQPAIEAAIVKAGLPANKRRTFLDDLFCPALDFYTWHRLEHMLRARGCQDIQRWGEAARLDHEASLADYREDLEALHQLFASPAVSPGASPDLAAAGGLEALLFAQGERMVAATVETVRGFESAVAAGEMSDAEAMQTLIGQGHHRVWAAKA